MLIRTFRMVSFYGRGRRPAIVPHIGELYHHEIVYLNEEEGLITFDRAGLEPLEVNHERLAQLNNPDAFKEEHSCKHRNLLGDICHKEPINGGDYCAFHEVVLKHHLGIVKI